MKVLILSCNTGGGHNSAGAAIAEALEKRGHEAILTDFLALAGQKVSKAVCGTYIGVVKNAPRSRHKISGLRCLRQGCGALGKVYK